MKAHYFLAAERELLVTPVLKKNIGKINLKNPLRNFMPNKSEFFTSNL